MTLLAVVWVRVKEKACTMNLSNTRLVLHEVEVGAPKEAVTLLVEVGVVEVTAESILIHDYVQYLSLRKTFLGADK